MFLIVGLGNPGPEYEGTRHNIGYRVVDALCGKYRIGLTQHQHHAVYGAGQIKGSRVLVAKPLTYMNESGRAVRSMASSVGIPSQEIVVVHDDIDLALGKIKVKHKGGDAGQRGVRSIINRLQTDLFTRIRVGVGRPEGGEGVVDYVLSPFTEEETGELGELIDCAVQKIETAIDEFKHRTLKEEEKE